ncbi:MAG: sce7726 family protein, partial [Thomasclavelia spiroformis]
RYVKENENITYGEAISQIYHYMDHSYRNEYFFKNTILNQLLIKKHDLYNTVALTELPIGDSKADFIMINGRGVVYEIKTDLDNLNRLNSQLSDYYKAFKYVNVVVGNKQYDKIKDILDESKVGIYVLGKNGNIRCKKKEKCNDCELSYETMFRILRKKEFESILLKHYGKLPEVNNFQYYRECLKWARRINIKTFQKDMLECLKKRMQLVVEDVFEETIPYELRFYTYFSKENHNQYELINEFWNEKLEV